MKQPRFIFYIIVLVINLVIALSTGNSPNESLNGFFSFIFLGIWICISIEYSFKIKKLREYKSSLNNFAFIFGSIGMGIFYAIWGDYTTILTGNLIAGNINFNAWMIILAIPYMFFSMSLLFLCISKYTSIYFGNKSINARTYIIFASVIYLFIDIFYLLMSQGVIFDTTNIFEPETSALNLPILLNLSILIFYLIIVIISANRRPITLRFSMTRVSNRLTNIDRRIEDADNFVNSALRGERNAQEQARQEKARQVKARQVKACQEKARKRNQKEQERTRIIQAKKAKKSFSSPRIQSSRSSSSSRIQRSTSSSSKSSRKRELLAMKPKTGMLTKDDFKCIFCFELPTTSDGHRGIVLCPNCRYPAHVDEFKDWVRNSNLCSRCDGTISSSFRRNPKVISVSEYLRAYKFWKKKF